MYKHMLSRQYFSAASHCCRAARILYPSRGKHEVRDGLCMSSLPRLIYYTTVNIHFATGQLAPGHFASGKFGAKMGRFRAKLVLGARCPGASCPGAKCMSTDLLVSHGLLAAFCFNFQSCKRSC